MSKLTPDYGRSTYLTVPVVYSIEGSITLPSIVGLDISNTASDNAQIKNKDISASWDPKDLR